METRKLIKSGQSSLVIALPQKWLSSNKCKKGDIVTLDFIENNILISPFQKKNVEEPEFLIENKPEIEPFLEQILYAAFLSDKNIILIRNFEKIKMYDLLKLIKKLPYVKIDEKGENYLKLLFVADLKLFDLKREIGKTVLFFENFFDILLHRDGETDKINELRESYSQISFQILMLMKTIKMNFQNYDKGSVLKFKQQIDSYYFLLKNCREFLRDKNIIIHLDEGLKKDIDEITQELKDIMALEAKNKSHELLQKFDLVERKKKSVAEKIMHEKDVNKIKIHLILSNIYEVAINVIFAHINNQ